MIKALKTLIKYFYYPRIIITIDEYNFPCFLLFLISILLIGSFTQYLMYYMLFSVLYLMSGNVMPVLWYEEVYTKFGNKKPEREE